MVSPTLGGSAIPAYKAALLVDKILGLAFRTSSFSPGSIRDILLKGSFNSVLPVIDRLAVELERRDKIHNIGYWHAMSQNP